MLRTMSASVARAMSMTSSSLTLSTSEMPAWRMNSCATRETDCCTTTTSGCSARMRETIVCRYGRSCCRIGSSDMSCRPGRWNSIPKPRTSTRGLPMLLAIFLCASDLLHTTPSTYWHSSTLPPGSFLMRTYLRKSESSRLAARGATLRHTFSTRRSTVGPQRDAFRCIWSRTFCSRYLRCHSEASGSSGLSAAASSPLAGAVPSCDAPLTARKLLVSPSLALASGVPWTGAGERNSSGMTAAPATGRRVWRDRPVGIMSSDRASGDVGRNGMSLPALSASSRPYASMWIHSPPPLSSARERCMMPMGEL
eukprot:Unigene8684_Nuclearia_a/m.26579 Unigene8684_Nuclearia_a/g.26579  ORF Unigene8684_Nuclearia_a/g.26579 Unigene8684_Nuclearia_a/m.26579 type:complete len:310 (-) Unigene8684_Nuclearia_a:676-1605(-)